MKENSREDRINNAYCFLNSMHSDFRTGLYYKEDLENLEHILSNYKRILKENEELRQEKIDNQRINLLAQNSMLDYQNGYEDGKANRRSAVQIIMDNQQYYIFQKQIEKYEKEIEKLQKENEKLKNRCRNLDKEAQGYFEGLVGDNTLSIRTIKQLQEENKTLKADNYELNNMINDLLDNIPVQKVKDKIEKEKLPLVIIGGRKNKKTLEYGIKLGRRQALRELIEEREDK